MENGGDDDDDGDGTPDGDDCAPLDASINPDATEICGDGVDNDCNPETDCFTVNGEPLEPVEGEETPVDFYDYGGGGGFGSAAPNTGFEISNRTVVIFYQEADGDLALVLLHDQAGDGSNGDVTLNLSGAPGAAVVLFDDTGETDSFDFDPDTGTGTFSWSWGGGSADGMVLGDLGAQFCITLDVTDSNNMDGYAVIGEGGATTLIDDYDAPLTLCGGSIE